MSARAVPLPLKLALAGVLLESMALLAGAAAVVSGALTAGLGMDVFGVAVPLAVVLAGFALLLVGSGRALWRGLRWGRGPVVTWQLLQIVTAIALAPDLPLAAVIVTVTLSAAVVAGVLWPSSREHAATTRSPGLA